MCVAASLIPAPIEIANDDLAVAESANPQFGYGGYGGGRGFGRRHRHRGGYGGKLYAETYSFFYVQRQQLRFFFKS